MALGPVPEDLRFFLKVSDVPVLKMLLDINCMDTLSVCLLFSLQKHMMTLIPGYLR